MHQKYRKQCKETNKLLRKTKTQFFSNQILACGRDQKTIFKLTNSWMGTISKKLSCDESNEEKMANEFTNFFVNKLNQIRKDIVKTLNPHNPYLSILSENDPEPSNLLQTFKPATHKEVEGIVLSSVAKCCELDPVPTPILKNIVHLVSPFIAGIINKSFISGSVPQSMKLALVRPQIKEPSLDQNDLSNYRPISNLSFLSKILEKAVNSRLDAHLESNSLLSNHQSAYRKHHSTETVLIKVQNDILSSLDSGYATILLMLDLSAAFDVVSHDRLLGRQREYFGIQGEALNWMSSYLHGRSQCIVVGSKKSSTVNIKYGFPQGSVLGGDIYHVLHTIGEHNCPA